MLGHKLVVSRHGIAVRSVEGTVMILAEFEFILHKHE